MSQSTARRLSRREVKRRLRNLGWRPIRQTGSHEIWESPTGVRVPVTAGHEGQTIAVQIVRTLQRAGATL